VTTGVTTVYVTIDSGDQAAGLGTVKHEGNGQWTYFPTQAETNGDAIVFLFTNATAVYAEKTIYTRASFFPSSWPTPTPGATPDTTWLDLITESLIEIGSYAPDDAPDAVHIELGRRILNDILDSWSARKPFAYRTAFADFTLTPAHQPHLIGLGLSNPDFAATAPAEIQSASIVIAGLEYPLSIRDADWWAGQNYKTLSTSLPSDLFYDGTVPSGSLYLWPVPATAYTLRLGYLVNIGQVAQADLTVVVVLGYGYREAIKLTLAERLCRPMSRPMPPGLQMDANNARCVVMNVNIKSKPISCAGYGQGGGYYNILTGRNQ
jgi:hypothetical protein